VQITQFGKVHGNVIERGGRGVENIKYMLRFAPKLPSICFILQSQLEYMVLHILYSLTWTGVWRWTPQRF